MFRHTIEDCFVNHDVYVQQVYGAYSYWYVVYDTNPREFIQYYKFP